MGRVSGPGLEIIILFNPGDIRKMNQAIFPGLKARCEELMARHPDRRELFAGYVRRQVEENAFLENGVVCAVMAMRRKSAADGA